MRPPPQVEVDEHADAQIVDGDRGRHDPSPLFSVPARRAGLRFSSAGAIANLNREKRQTRRICRSLPVDARGSNAWSQTAATRRRRLQRWMRVDSTMAEWCAPRRRARRCGRSSGRARRSSGAATMAIRSNGPLTECSMRTSAMRRSAASIGADLRGSSVISTWARTSAASTSSRHADRVAGDHALALEPRQAALHRGARQLEARAPARPSARARCRAAARAGRGRWRRGGSGLIAEEFRRNAELYQANRQAVLFSLQRLRRQSRHRRSARVMPGGCHEEHPDRRRRQDRPGGCGAAGRTPAATTASRWPTVAGGAGRRHARPHC